MVLWLIDIPKLAPRKRVCDNFKCSVAEFLVMKSVYALLILAILLTPSLASSGPLLDHAPRIHIKDGTSLNWSGYAVETSLSKPQTGAVTDVKGTWTVPSVSAKPNGYSSFWIGIDGYSSNTVEQIGTDSDSPSGTPTYYAWYEMYPKSSATIKMTIHPGDSITAEVKYSAPSSFVLTINDVTAKTTFSTTQTLPNAKRTSAEWIAEAPSSGGVLPLADFGTVTFKNAQATLNGHTGNINDAAWKYDALTMTTSTGTIKAQPSGLTGGTSFTVKWDHS